MKWLCQVVRSIKLSLVSSLLYCDTSAGSLHARKIERHLIPVSSSYTKFGVISWSFEWARADLTTEIRLRRIMPTSLTDRGRVACLANSPSPRGFYKRMGFDQAEHDLCYARDHGAWSRLSSPGFPLHDRGPRRIKKIRKISGMYFNLFWNELWGWSSFLRKKIPIFSNLAERARKNGNRASQFFAKWFGIFKI